MVKKKERIVQKIQNNLSDKSNQISNQEKFFFFKQKKKKKRKKKKKMNSKITPELLKDLAQLNSKF